MGRTNSTWSHSYKTTCVEEIYKGDILPLWVTDRTEMEDFIEEANSYHPTMKFTAEISERKVTFLDTTVFKGE